MLIAGIAWTGQGFEVALVDGHGRRAAPPAHFPAGHVLALTDHLRALDQPLLCVVESTNGMVDGGLMTAGLRVHRADPWTLPPRPEFGSVDADTLARAAVDRLPELPRLTIDGGSLTGRIDELDRLIHESEPGLGTLSHVGRWFSHGKRSSDDRVVALTFDDGPHPPFTGRILDILDRYGVSATFFCVGLHASAHTEELARMADSGHRLGNHTWSHPYLPDLSVQELAMQLERTEETITAATGLASSHLFRPPYGSRSPKILSWLAEVKEGPTTVLWDVEPLDWALPGPDAITRIVLEQVQPGSVILLHDGGGDRSQTAEALPSIIEGLLVRGYRFALADELAR